MEDRDLLRAYLEEHSEQAFAELVARHVNLVYATALRMVGDGAMAEDITQTVFIHLARNAAVIREGNALPAWLYRATQGTSAKAIRGEQRRRRRERDAMILSEAETDSACPSAEVTSLLDSALRQLKPVEQDIVVLRFFKNKSIREVGEALALSEDAVQKRLSRAVEKMRANFARSGVTMASAVVATALSAQAGKTAPAGLASRVANASLLRANSMGITILLAKFIFMTTKTKIILVAAVVAVLVAALFLKRQTGTGSDLPKGPVAQSQVKSEVNRATPKVELPVVRASQPQPAPDRSKTDEAKPAGDPRDNLDSAILEAIRLVESGDELAYSKAFYPPAEMEQLLELRKNTPIDQIDTRFDPQDAVAWLQAFNQIKGQTPVYSADGSEAVFKLEPPVEHYFDYLSFVKVNGLWYRSNSGAAPLWYRQIYEPNAARR